MCSVLVVCEECWEVTKMDKMTLLQKNVLSSQKKVKDFKQ